MDNQKITIVFIDRSELLKEGLQSVLSREFFNLNIVHFSNFPASIKTILQYEPDLVVLNPNLLWKWGKDPEQFFVQLKSNSIKVIGLNVESFDSQMESLFDGAFQSDDTSDQILKLFRSFHQKEKSEEEETSTLSQREVEVIQQIIDGNSNKEIAENLYISTHTVITHRKNITHKLGIKSISGLTIYAILNGLVEIDEYRSEMGVS